MRTFFLAWQDPASRRWFPVGRLTCEDERYRFGYTYGAQVAEHDGGFSGLPSFPDLNATYESESLFPIFSNLLDSDSRADWVEWVSVPEHENDPMALLAQSGVQRLSEGLEIFPSPQPDGNGLYHIHFFAHGLRYFPHSAIERAERLQPGDPLLLVLDIQNPKDPRALMLRTAQQEEGDIHLLGYCPRYLLDDALELMLKTQVSPSLTVRRVNLPPAPIQYRLLVRMTMAWPRGFQPFSSRTYQVIETDVFNVGEG